MTPLASAQQVPRDVLPGEAVAFALETDDAFAVVDVEGRQVSDLVVFSRFDNTERLSPGNTRKLNRSWLLTTGHVLYSTKCQPLLGIAADSVGRHDLTSSACSPYDYPIRFGLEEHPSCLAALTDALAPHGIPEHLIPDPFNVFMNVALSPTGEVTVEEPASRAGDSITFKALCPVIVALTCCPQDQNACNGGRPTTLRIDPVGPNA